MLKSSLGGYFHFDYRCHFLAWIFLRNTSDAFFRGSRFLVQSTLFSKVRLKHSPLAKNIRIFPGSLILPFLRPRNEPKRIVTVISRDEIHPNTIRKTLVISVFTHFLDSCANIVICYMSLYNTTSVQSRARPENIEPHLADGRRASY